MKARLFLLLYLSLKINGQDLNNSCVGQCGDEFDAAKPCHCNNACVGYKDCCADFHGVCQWIKPTCFQRCHNPSNSSFPCQCNEDCVNKYNCCRDYIPLCGHIEGSGACVRTPITDDEILGVSESLWFLDNNSAEPCDVIISLQSNTTTKSKEDLSLNKFFTYVNTTLFKRPTYAAMISLFDNYERPYGVPENYTDQEKSEIDHFLDLFLSTPIGNRLFDFFYSKGLTNCGDESVFKDILYRIWFEPYSRRAGVMDSSGFEHVFVGEQKGRRISGFHNWVKFYLEEQNGSMNYHGYVSKDEPRIYGVQFSWHGLLKPIGGGMVGVSPEIELALFTLCHVARPSKKCKVRLSDLDGNPTEVEIQTWVWSKANPGNGFNYVSSSYFLS